MLACGDTGAGHRCGVHRCAGKMAAMEGVSLLDPSIDVFTAEERPDLWEAARTLFRDVWPEYNHHGTNTPVYFGSLFPEHAAFQVLFVDKNTDRVVARGRSIPFRWDGSEEDLPHGIDAAGIRAVESGDSPTALSALAAEVANDHQGNGLSGLVIQSLAAVARTAGFTWLVAPVRPSWKDRYPLTPIERYATHLGTRRRPSVRSLDASPCPAWCRHHQAGTRPRPIEPGSRAGRRPVPQGPGAKRRALDAGGAGVVCANQPWLPSRSLVAGPGRWLGLPSWLERCSSLYRLLEGRIRSGGRLAPVAISVEGPLGTRAAAWGLPVRAIVDGHAAAFWAAGVVST